MYDERIKNRILVDIDRSDKYSDYHKYLSIFITVSLTCIGVVITKGNLLNEWWLLFLGVLTAGLGAINKMIDPSSKAENIKLRKRVLELLSIEAERETPAFTQEEAERLMFLAKQDAPRVYEAVLLKTMPSMV